MEAAKLEKTVAKCLETLGKDAPTLLLRRETLGRSSGVHTVADQVDRAVALLQAAGPDAFKIEGTLGEGGMGIVHVATQASLGRRVALKKLRPALRTNETTLKLLREAWVIGSLEHPNILPIHDVRLDEEGAPEMVLKRIEGVAWCDVISDPGIVKKRFGAGDLLEHNIDVLQQVCRAVHFAHSRGIVHRDLKPSNVMIGMHGEVYLLDWGIAVSLRDDPDGRMPLATGSSEVVGTPGYMAPELLQCGEVTERTDVYLLGAILYEILTGEPPHKGETPRDVVVSVIVSSPSTPNGAPAELAAIVQRAMQPDPRDRFASAEELRLALDGYRKHKNAVRLAEEANRRLDALVALSRDPGTVSRRAQAYGIYGGCCFGFREALAIWPDYALARQGIVRAVEAMVELELAWGEPTAASELLAELTDPPEELALRVDEAVMASLRERERIASLVKLGEDRDAKRGARARRILVGALGLSWTIAPTATALTVDPQKSDYPPMLLAPIVTLAMLIGLTLWRREELQKTAINRGVVATIAVGLIAQTALAASSPLMGVNEVQSRTYILLVWAVAIGSAAFTIDRRLFWGAAAALAGFIISAAYATSVAHLLYAMSAMYFLVSLNALAIWRPRAPAPKPLVVTSVRPPPSASGRSSP